MFQDYPPNKNVDAIHGLVRLLGLLRIAGLQKRHMTMSAAMNGQTISRYCIRMAVVTTAVPYLVCVPFHKADEVYKFIYA